MSRLCALLGCAVIWASAGCATRSVKPTPAALSPAKTHSAPNETASAPAPAPATPATKSGEPTVKTPAVAAEEPVPAGMMRIRVESQPAGALIVVGDRVVGHAPLTVNVPVTLQGFFSERTLIRARFLAADGASESTSVKENFEPVDRVPQAVLFTPTGASRVATP